MFSVSNIIIPPITTDPVPLYSPIREPINVPENHVWYHCRVTDPSGSQDKYIKYLYQAYNYHINISSFIYCVEDEGEENEHLHIHLSASDCAVANMRNWLRQTCHLNGRPTKGVKSQYSMKLCRSIEQSAIYTCKDSSGCLGCCFGYSDNYSASTIKKYQNSSYKKEEKRDWGSKLQIFIDGLKTDGYFPLDWNGSYIEGDIGMCTNYIAKIIDYFITNCRAPPARSFIFRLLLKNKLITTSLYIKVNGLLIED